MQDKYQSFAHSAFGKFLCKNLGLPVPAYLKRFKENQWLVPSILVVEDAGQTAENVAICLQSTKVTSLPYEQALSAAQQQSEHYDGATFDGVVFDARNLQTSADLQKVYQFFHQAVKQINNSGKVTILAAKPNKFVDKKWATAQFALSGFVKSLAKELGRKGITANLLLCNINDEKAQHDEQHSYASALQFLQSYRSAYVNAQTIDATSELDFPYDDNTPLHQPLVGKVALVTGASRGIGSAIAQTLARDGATIIGLDIEPAKQALIKGMNAIGGKIITLDVSAHDAPQTLVDELNVLGGAVDIVVHNAGITRDKMLSRMDQVKWQQVMQINLTAIEAMNDALLANDMINQNGRIIGVSSISGVAGNVGQTNYATSKAGVWGMVAFKDPQLAERGITINAVAPGFIETEMTAKIPFLTRQFGRRFCSLSQAGLPIDVAETISFFASPQSASVSGNLVRVCGQNLLGA